MSNGALRFAPGGPASDTYAVNGLNQHTAINAASPAYDGNGNMATDALGRSFAHDAENVLRLVRALGGATIAALTI